MSESQVSQVDAIDPRGPQFAAAITTAHLGAILLTAPSRLGLLLLGAQVVLFLTGALLGVRSTPWTALFRRFVRPRLAPPAHLEDPRPPQFAQAVGLTFVTVALAAYLVGATSVGAIAVGFALAAALLNAAFGLCLGCELYLTMKKMATPALRVARTSAPALTID